MKSILRLLIAGCGAMLLLLSFSPAAFADQSDKTIASLTKAALKLPTSAFPGTNPRGELEQCPPGRRAVRSLQSTLSSEVSVRVHHHLLDCSTCRAAWLCATGGGTSPFNISHRIWL